MRTSSACPSATSQPGSCLKKAIEYARRKDVVLVAAVGNKPKDPIIGYPAAYPGVIAVGGVDQQGQHAPFSVTGPEVDITAPAVSIISTRLNGSYATRTAPAPPPRSSPEPPPSSAPPTPTYPPTKSPTD